MGSTKELDGCTPCPVIRKGIKPKSLGSESGIQVPTCRAQTWKHRYPGPLEVGQAGGGGAGDLGFKYRLMVCNDGGHSCGQQMKSQAGCHAGRTQRGVGVGGGQRETLTKRQG